VVPLGEFLAVFPVILVDDKVEIDVFDQHFGPLLPGRRGFGGAQSGPDGKFLLKTRMTQKFPGIVVQDQITLQIHKPSNNHGISHVLSLARIFDLFL